MTERTIQAVGYEALAAEYYDAARHPTCANFGFLSRKLLSPWLQLRFHPGDSICEVGPGRSFVAQWLSEHHHPLNHLILVESSPGMAQYSLDWGTSGARILEADAHRIPLRENTMSIIVASLGDPYNDRAFWREAHRVLKVGGAVLYSTPAYEWAQEFRGKNNTAKDVAEFELADGRLVGVPSLIRHESDQMNMISSAGFEVARVAHATVRDLASERLSPKLNLDWRGAQDRIVTAYLAVAR